MLSAVAEKKAKVARLSKATINVYSNMVAPDLSWLNVFQNPWRVLLVFRTCRVIETLTERPRALASTREFDGF